MIFKRVFLVTSFVILLLSIGFLAGYFTKGYVVEEDIGFPILLEAYDILREHGINPPPPDPRLEYGMIHGMVRAYGDPYTMFVEPIQHELESNILQGAFGGIGVNLEKDSAGRVLLFPFPGSPAEEVGVKEGDVLLAVNDIPLAEDTTIDAIVTWLRGPVGERVKISIVRGADNTLHEFQINRIEFPIPSVAWHLDFEDRRIGVILINLIAASTPEELKTAIEDLEKRGARAYILDLRNNLGGLLTAGVDIARLFLEGGIVIEQRYRDKGIETYSVERPGVFLDIPIAIIINQNTASAAEIVAGAIKRHGRGIVLGSPSMGKDSIQLVFELSDNSSLHVTAAKWWIPNLEPGLGDAGVQPDVMIADNADNDGYDLAFAEARKILANQLLP